MVFFFVFAGAGLGGVAGEFRYKSQTQHYFVLIAFEWVLLAYVWFGLRRGGSSLRQIIGGKWNSARDVFRDIGIAFAFWLAALAILAIVQFLLRNNDVKRLAGFAPQGISGVLLWAVVCASAGFCEETIFRGYLQRQFHALTNRTQIAILLQGALFGIVHGYQGWKFVVTISVFGILFGILAAWRKSVRPGMITHGWQDMVGGIALKFVSKIPPR